mgnify:FL=1
MRVIIVLSVLALTASAAYNPVSTTTKPNKEPYDIHFNSVCTNRAPQMMCTMSIYTMCICYNNGTCVEKFGNKCNVCSNKNVFSVSMGKCPVEHPYLCQPQIAPQTYPSTRDSVCICTKDGKCSMGFDNKARKCKESNTLAVFPKRCPAENLQATTKPKILEEEVLLQVGETRVCTTADRFTKIACPAVVRDYGCVTYTDGTQRYVPVNMCTCQSPRVVKYAVGQQC